MRASVALLFSNIQVASIGLSLAGSYQCPNFSIALSLRAVSQILVHISVSRYANSTWASVALWVRSCGHQLSSVSLRLSFNSSVYGRQSP